MDIHKFFTQSGSIITKAIQAGVIPGGVLGVIQEGQPHVRAFGYSSYNLNMFRSRWENHPPGAFSSQEISREKCDLIYGQEPSRLIQADSIYDCASITKSIPLALIALRLIERGNISIYQKVSEFIDNCSEDIGNCTLWNLLTHTIDFQFSIGAVARSGDSVVDTILNRSFSVPAGEVYCYSNSSSIVLTMILEEVTGKCFEELTQEEVFQPLHLNDSSFGDERAQPVEYCSWRRRVVRGEVHDESASALLPKKTGAAGLFSNVPDILKVIDVLQRCYCGESDYLSSRSVKSLLKNQIPQLATTSLGMEFKEPRFMGAMGNQLETLGKTGFTGCHWQWAPEKALGLVFLSNYPWPRRLKSAQPINAMRSQLGDCAMDCSI